MLNFKIVYNTFFSVSINKNSITLKRYIQYMQCRIIDKININNTNNERNNGRGERICNKMANLDYSLHFAK